MSDQPKKQIAITPMDLKLVQPIIEAHVAKADDKAKRTFGRSPSILAAQIADEAQAKGITKTREEWRGIYYPLRDKIIPALFPRLPKAQPATAAA